MNFSKSDRTALREVPNNFEMSVQGIIDRLVDDCNELENKLAASRDSRQLSDVRKLIEKAFKDGIHEANMGNIDYENGCSDGAAFQAWAKKNLPEHIR